jgi:hypothetical protein
MCVSIIDVMARVLGVILLAVAPAAAEPELGLAWSAPAGCPDAATMRARIEQRLGSSLDDVAVDRIAIAIERDGDALVARVDLREPEPRTLKSASCDELADAVAVIVARIAAKRIAAREIAPAPAVVVRAPEPAAPARWSFGARLATVSGVGALPGVGLGGELDAFVRRGPLAAELGVTSWLAGTARDSIMNDQVTVGLSAAALRLGWRSPWPVAAWLVGEIGSMTAIGTTAYDDHRLTGQWLAIGAGVGVEWNIRRWVGLVGTFEALDTVDRTRFQLADGTIVFEPKRASARISVGAEVRWP